MHRWAKWRGAEKVAKRWGVLKFYPVMRFFGIFLRVISVQFS